MEVDDPSGRVVEVRELPRDSGRSSVPSACSAWNAQRSPRSKRRKHAIEEGRNFVRAVVVDVSPETSWAWSRAPRRSTPRSRAAGSRPGNAPSARRRRRPASWPSCRAGRSSSGKERSSKLLLDLRRRRAFERHHGLEDRYERTSVHRRPPDSEGAGAASPGPAADADSSRETAEVDVGLGLLSDRRSGPSGAPGRGTRRSLGSPRPTRGTQARTPRPSTSAAAADRDPRIGHGDDREGDQADRADEHLHPGRRAQLIADPDQPLALAVLLLGGHDFQDQPRVASRRPCPTRTSRCRAPCPSDVRP